MRTQRAETAKDERERASTGIGEGGSTGRELSFPQPVLRAEDHGEVTVTQACVRGSCSAGAWNQALRVEAFQRPLSAWSALESFRSDEQPGTASAWVDAGFGAEGAERGQ